MKEGDTVIVTTGDNGEQEIIIYEAEEGESESSDTSEDSAASDASSTATE